MFSRLGGTGSLEYHPIFCWGDGGMVQPAPSPTDVPDGTTAAWLDVIDIGLCSDFLRHCNDLRYPHAQGVALSLLFEDAATPVEIPVGGERDAPVATVAHLLSLPQITIEVLCKVVGLQGGDDGVHTPPIRFIELWGHRDVPSGDQFKGEADVEVGVLGLELLHEGDVVLLLCLKLLGAWRDGHRGDDRARVQ